MLVELENLVLSKTVMRLVNKSSLEYISLRDSIRAHGILTALTVRKLESKWLVIAGAHRYMCAVDLGLKEVPCIEINIPDSEILMVQIHENLHRSNPNYYEYIDAIRNYLAINPSLTFNEFCRQINKSPDWVSNILKLVWLCPEATELLKNRKLSLQMATALRLLPEHIQQQLILLIDTIPRKEFINKCRQHTRELRELATTDKIKKHYHVADHQIPFARATKALVREFEHYEYFDKVIVQRGITDRAAIWTEALKWALQIDQITIQERKAKWQAMNDRAYKQHLKRETIIKEKQ